MKDPQSVIVIRNQRVSVGVNAGADEKVKLTLSKIARTAQSQADKEYDDELEAMLDRYFAWNGYTPKLSDFYNLSDPRGLAFINLPLDWALVE